MPGSHNHLQRESPAPCPVELFSISSRGRNTSLAQQGLSAASPHTATLCRRDHRVPGSERSASSLRTSRRMKRSANRRAGDATPAFPTVLLTPNSAQRFQCISHQLQMPNVLIVASIIFSHDHPAPDSHAKYIFEQGQDHRQQRLDDGDHGRESLPESRRQSDRVPNRIFGRDRGPRSR